MYWCLVAIVPSQTTYFNLFSRLHAEDRLRTMRDWTILCANCPHTTAVILTWRASAGRQAIGREGGSRGRMLSLGRGGGIFTMATHPLSVFIVMRYSTLMHPPILFFIVE